MSGSAWEILRFRGLDSLQNLHPVIVHFPIAFLTTAVLFYLLAWVFQRDSLAIMGLWLLSLGVVSAVISVYTGLSASESIMIAPSVREQILVYHERLMLTVVGVSLVLTAWAWLARPMPKRARIVFVAGLFAMFALLAKGADFGGWMVYRYNAGGSLPQPIEFSQ